MNKWNKCIHWQSSESLVVNIKSLALEVAFLQSIDDEKALLERKPEMFVIRKESPGVAVPKDICRGGVLEIEIHLVAPNNPPRPGIVKGKYFDVLAEE